MVAIPLRLPKIELRPQHLTPMGFARGLELFSQETYSQRLLTGSMRPWLSGVPEGQLRGVTEAITGAVAPGLLEFAELYRSRNGEPFAQTRGSVTLTSGGERSTLSWAEGQAQREALLGSGPRTPELLQRASRTVYQDGGVTFPANGAQAREAFEVVSPSREVMVPTINRMAEAYNGLARVMNAPRSAKAAPAVLAELQRNPSRLFEEIARQVVEFDGGGAELRTALGRRRSAQLLRSELGAVEVYDALAEFMIERNALQRQTDVLGLPLARYVGQHVGLEPSQLRALSSAEFRFSGPGRGRGQHAFDVKDTFEPEL